MYSSFLQINSQK